MLAIKYQSLVEQGARDKAEQRRKQKEEDDQTRNLTPQQRRQRDVSTLSGNKVYCTILKKYYQQRSYCVVNFIAGKFQIKTYCL